MYDVILGKRWRAQPVQHRQHLRAVIRAVIEHMDEHLPRLA